VSLPRNGPAIYKFGGTSLANSHRLAGVAGLVADAVRPPLVVVSATGNTTDRLAVLLEAAPEARPALLDQILGAHRELLHGLEANEALGGELARCGEAAGFGLAELQDPRTQARGRDRILSLGEDLSVWALTAALRGRGVPAEPVDARTVIRTDRAFGQAMPAEAAVRDLAASRLLPLLARGVVPVRSRGSSAPLRTGPPRPWVAGARTSRRCSWVRR